MLKESIKKFKESISKQKEQNNKKNIENLVVFLILLIITIIAINTIWGGKKEETNQQTIVPVSKNSIPIGTVKAIEKQSGMKFK